MAKWKKEEKKAETVVAPKAPVAEVAPKAPVEPEPIIVVAKAPEPVIESVIEKPAEKVYTLGFNHDKYRQECGKCKGTQILITGKVLKDGPGGPDGKPTKVKDYFIFTCNDCKQTYKGQ